MAEPTLTTAGSVSLTVLFVSLLGPMAGPYVLIILASIAGSTWPLAADKTLTRSEGAWLMLRCSALALVLTGVIAGALERMWGIPVSEGLAAVALMIGAMGNGWRPVFAALETFVQGLAGNGGVHK